MTRINSENKQKWLKAIREQQASGLSKTQWCKNHGVSDDMLRYWTKRLIPKTEAPPAFTELSDPVSSTLYLEYKNIKIQISSANYDSKLLKTLLSDLGALC